MKSILILMVCALAVLAAGCGDSGPKAALTITDANFDDTIRSGVTLVDFWATWCPPCRTQGPIVERVAAAYKGKAKVGKLDVDTNKKTARRFEVNAIPTLIIFKDGKMVRKFVGLQQEGELRAALDRQL
jgi:thioredoxin 1